MLNTMNIIEIMRSTDAVYECDKLDHGQNIDSFKEISDPKRIKRFVLFKSNQLHDNYQSTLTDSLKNAGNGDAVITMKITEQNGNLILSDRGFTSATFVDLSKVSFDEKLFLSELIRNTQIKMQLDKVQSKTDKLNAAIAQIQDGANKTKSGLDSRYADALKQIIAEAIENTK